MKNQQVSITAFKVVRVLDGDTIEVEFADYFALFGGKICVRIRGMQAPEVRTRNHAEKVLGLRAKLFLEDLVKNAGQVVLLNPERGKYFRLIADVIIDGHSVRRLMFKAGHATAWDGKGAKHDWSKEL